MGTINFSRSIANSLGVLLFPSLVDVNLNHALRARAFYESRRKSHFSPSLQIFVETTLRDYVRDITIFSQPKEHTRALLRELMLLPVRAKQVAVDSEKFRY